MLKNYTAVQPRSRTPGTGIRYNLRAATARAHERLDSWARRVNLSDQQNYGRFLEAQSGPVNALEAALQNVGVVRLLPDWSVRSRATALEHDLRHLGLQPQSCPSVRLTSAAQAFGTLYVLEGSRLGARVLLQQILNATPALEPATKFLRHGSDRRLWTTFLQALETKVRIDDLAKCAQGAGDAFALFESSFRQKFGALS